MSVFLLDSSFCIDWLRENARARQGPATQWLMRNPGAGLATSIFTACELEAGACMSRDSQFERKKLRTFFDHVKVIQPGPAFPSYYGRVLAALRASGSLIQVMDLLIACIAIQEDLPILTRDDAHFPKIAELELERY